MLTARQLYYLQTMSINPWVMRCAASSELITVVMDEKIHDARQNQLLYAMFRSIGVSNNRLDMIHHVSAEHLNHHIQKIHNKAL